MTTTRLRKEQPQDFAPAVQPAKHLKSAAPKARPAAQTGAEDRKFPEGALDAAKEFANSHNDLYNHVILAKLPESLKLVESQMPWVGMMKGDEKSFVWGMAGRKTEGADHRRATVEASNIPGGMALTLVTHVPLGPTKLSAQASDEDSKTSGLLNLTRLSKPMRTQIHEMWMVHLHNNYQASELVNVNKLNFEELMVAYPELPREILTDNDKLRMVIFTGRLADAKGRALPGVPNVALGLAKREYVSLARPSEAEIAALSEAGTPWKPAVEVRFMPHIPVN